MRSDSDLTSSFLLSLVVHLSVALVAQAVLFSVRSTDLTTIFEPLPIVMLPLLADGPGDGLPPPPARGSPEEAAPALRVEPDPPPVVASVPKPIPPKLSPRRRSGPVPRRAVPPPPASVTRPEPPPPPAAAAAPEVAAVPPAVAPAVPGAAVSGKGSNKTPGHPEGWQLSGDGRSYVKRKVYGTGGSGGGKGRGRYFAPDTPGYYGRLLAQVSVPSSRSTDSYYGRVHLIPQDGRDYSSQTLFGYSFRENFAGGGFREFQVGRVQTHGAYLMVTDLYRDGRHSTMGHTVILAFPRSGTQAFRVGELGGGSFRMSGPDGSSLDFDGRSGRLERARGFKVAPPGEIGSPPRVGFAGVHVKIQSVGGNPFLRGRAATVYDGRGGSCPLSTTELFVHRGTNESDMFRFGTDRQFFEFLEGRCPGLDLPRATDTQVAKRSKSKAEAKSSGSSGLIPAIIDLFR